MNDRELAAEIIDSLGIGDHRDLDRLTIRAAVGFFITGWRYLRRPRGVVTDHSHGLVHVIANPVAHGAALASAVTEALQGLDVVRLADARLADRSIDVRIDAAGLAPKSMSRILSREGINFAVRLRRSVGAQTLRSLSSNRPYAEYLFLAQAVRYYVAENVVAGFPTSSVMLVDFDRSAYGRPWIAAAKRRGLRTVTMVHGSPNRNYIPVLAGTVLTWSERQAEWFRQHNPETATAVIGRPEVEAVSRPHTPLRHVIICHSKEDLSGTEKTALVEVVAALRAKGIATTVRLHPSTQLDHLDALWAEVAGSADQVTQTREPFTAGLQDGDGVLCVASTSAVEAVIAGAPVAVLADPDRELPADLEPLRAADPVAALFAPARRGEIVAATGADAANLLAQAMSAAAAQ